MGSGVGSVYDISTANARSSALVAYLRIHSDFVVLQPSPLGEGGGGEGKEFEFHRSRGT